MGRTSLRSEFLESEVTCGERTSCYPWRVISRTRARACLGFAALLVVSLAACHKEEQVVEGVAKTAAKAEQRVQASETALDSERAQLEQIPLPTKSLYIDVHDPGQWSNPFLLVGPEIVTLRVLMPDANPSTVGQGTLLRPEAARRQELQLRPSDLEQAIVAIPTGAWRYGRVIAIAESPEAAPKDRLKVRRNVEIAIQRLNDLGVVVEEWPAR